MLLLLEKHKLGLTMFLASASMPHVCTQHSQAFTEPQQRGQWRQLSNNDGDALLTSKETLVPKAGFRETGSFSRKDIFCLGSLSQVLR